LTQRTFALNQSTDLVQAGVVFNDATRLLEGGLFSTPFDSNNQQAYLGEFTTDIHAVLNDLQADLADPNCVTAGGVAYKLSTADLATLKHITAQLQTELVQAPLTVGASTSTAVINAENSLHTTTLSILNEVAGDFTLTAALDSHPYASGTGALNVGFEQLQGIPGLNDNAAALTAATAHSATLLQIGDVFNAAAVLATGGLNSSNITEFNNDMKAIATGIQNILNNPTELAAIEANSTGAAHATAAALTTVHLDTVFNQIELQINKFDVNAISNNTTTVSIADRSTNDNLLDIIDIVQNDPALNLAAGGDGNAASIGGFAEQPAFLNAAGGVNAHGGTVDTYQDNQAQTNFWAQFLAEANTINNQLINVATHGVTPAAAAALITQIENYHTFGAAFDAGQGGIFGARFDNELLSGTLLADTNNAVAGLTVLENAAANHATPTQIAAANAQILAAGMGFAADAMDVSGNNTPVGGGTYVGTATTVFTATSIPGLATGTIPVPGVSEASVLASIHHMG
jgi:hypothetical protein